MNLLDRIAYDTGGYTVQEILSSFCKKIIEIIDLVNKNEEVCDEVHTIIENIRNEVVPDLVEDIMKELQDNGYFDSLVNVTLIEQLRTELTTLLNDAITDYTTRLDNFDKQLDNIILNTDGSVNIKQFGAIGDGINDDTEAIQKALNYIAINENVSKLVGTLGDYKVTSTLILPFANNRFRNIVVDFNGCNFKSDGCDVLFESGYMNNDVAKTSWNSNNEQYVTSQVHLTNFTVENFKTAIRVQNWNYGTKIDYVKTLNCNTTIHTKRCFYMILDNILAGTTLDFTLDDSNAIYIFEDNNNIMQLSNLRLPPRTKIGYNFKGAIESIKMYNCGIENADIGIKIDSECYGLDLDSVYFENTKSCIECSGVIRNLSVNNSWFYSVDGDYIFNIIGASHNLLFNSNNYIRGYKLFKTKGTEVSGIIELPRGYVGNNTSCTLDEFITTNNIPNSVNVRKTQTVFKSTTGFNSAYANTSLSNFHTSVQSGRYSTGYNNEIPLCNIENGTNNMTINTSIKYTDTQLIYFVVKIADTVGIKNHLGFIQGSTFYNLSGGTNDNISISKDSNDLVVITVNGLSNDSNHSLYGGQIMLLA